MLPENDRAPGVLTDNPAFDPKVNIVVNAFAASPTVRVREDGKGRGGIVEIHGLLLL